MDLFCERQRYDKFSIHAINPSYMPGQTYLNLEVPNLLPTGARPSRRRELILPVDGSSSLL
jgi:hypothetical protein